MGGRVWRRRPRKQQPSCNLPRGIHRAWLVFEVAATVGGWGQPPALGAPAEKRVVLGGTSSFLGTPPLMGES